MMKHFIDRDGVVFAFEPDGSQDHLITESMREIYGEELSAYLKEIEGEPLIDDGQ